MFIRFSVCLSVNLFFCLIVCHPASLCLSLFQSLPLPPPPPSLFVSSFLAVSLSPYLCLRLYLCICISVHLSLCIYLCISLSLSLYLSTSLSLYPTFNNIPNLIVSSYSLNFQLNKKSMVLKPWEVAPLGSKVTAFVHEVDSRRKRIGLTTYAPEQWNDMLPMKVSQ